MNILIRELTGGEPIIDESALEQFRREWSTYQKLVDSDVRSHKAVGDILHEAVMGQREPFSFLDIACGDANFMARSLSGTKISHYRGLDLSEPALRLARENLKDAPFAVELDHGDFVETLEKAPQPTDVAWCGLSIHHLRTRDKLDLLRAIRGAARRFLMIYEPTLLGGESREDYLRRFNDASIELKAVLTEDEWRGIVRHVTDCDFPEEPATWLSLGRDAGFTRGAEVFCDPTQCYRVYRYDC